MPPYASIIRQSKYKQFRKYISIVILLAFVTTSVKNPAYAQSFQPGTMTSLPTPGTMVHLSPEFTPAYLKGIVIHPENALKFDFIIYKGDTKLSDAQKRKEYTKLIKYFLASLAVPDDDQWVNLSPYEKDRIIRDDFGKTEMGRDLLAQDYILKQITASLIYPEDNLGKKFWDKVYTQAQAQYGTTNIPVNTFNKVWIVPDSALIYEKGNMAYVVSHHLKVMMEEDYLSLKKHTGIESGTRTIQPVNNTHSVASKIIKEIILPELQKEVNEGENFANLRQVYSGMILAAWFKRALKESLLGKIYADKSKLKGIDQNPKNNEAIYQQYLMAYKKGVFNYIKDDVNKYTNEIIPKKYFSGGAVSDGQVYGREARFTNNLGVVAQDMAGRKEQFDVVTELQQELPEARITAGTKLSPAMANLSVRMGGFMTLEANVTGVNKALALDYLGHHFDTILDRIGYTPGSVIDARQTQTVVTADGDGTTYGKPTATDNPLLADSAAYDDLLAYLRAGGLYMIISGNDLELTRKRLITTGVNGKPGLPVELRNRVIVVAQGAANMAYVNSHGNMVELEDYQQNAIVEYRDQVVQNLDLVYLGDDHKPDGNDFPGFKKVGFRQAITVTKEADEKIPEELRGNRIGDLEAGTGRFLREVVAQATRNPKARIFIPAVLPTLITQASNGQHTGYTGPVETLAGVMPDGTEARSTMLSKANVDALVAQGGEIIRTFLGQLAPYTGNPGESPFKDIATVKDVWAAAADFQAHPENFTDDRLVASTTPVRIEVRGLTSDGRAPQVAIIGVPSNYRRPGLEQLKQLSAAMNSVTSQRNFTYTAGGFDVTVHNPNHNMIQTAQGVISVGVSMLMRNLSPEAENFPSIVITPQGPWVGVDGSNMMQIYFAAAANYAFHGRKTTIVVRNQEEEDRIRAYFKYANNYDRDPAVEYLSPDVASRLRREAYYLADRILVDGHFKISDPVADTIKFEHFNSSGHLQIGNVSLTDDPDGKVVVSEGGQTSVLDATALKPLEIIPNIAHKTLGRPQFGVTFLGTSSGMDPNGLTSNHIVWAGKQSILFDVGATTVTQMNVLGLSPADINYVLITHVHEDHVAGLLSYFHWAKQMGQTVQLIVEPAVYSDLKKMMKAILNQELEQAYPNIKYMPLKFYQDMLLGEGKKQVLIESVPAFHGTTTTMARVTYQGQTIGLSSDTTYAPLRYQDILTNNLPEDTAADLRQHTNYSEHQPVFDQHRADELTDWVFQTEEKGRSPKLVVYEVGYPNPTTHKDRTNHTSPYDLERLAVKYPQVAIVTNHAKGLPEANFHFNHAVPLDSVNAAMSASVIRSALLALTAATTLVSSVFANQERHQEVLTPGLHQNADNSLDRKGGIDFNAANLNLQIKRNGNGVPLPISQQDWEHIDIDGLVPFIIGIRPALSLPGFFKVTKYD